MAKKEPAPIPGNPLVCGAPSDTLVHAAAVVDFLSRATTEDVPGDDFEFGRYLVMVREALTFEAARFAQSRS